MIELNRIYNEDCIEGLKQIEDKKIDIIITSPPYNFDMNYDTYNDKISWDNYKTWLFSVWQECFRVLKDGGYILFKKPKELFEDSNPILFSKFKLRQVLESCGFLPNFFKKEKKDVVLRSKSKERCFFGKKVFEIFF